LIPGIDVSVHISGSLYNRILIYENDFHKCNETNEICVIFERYYDGKGDTRKNKSPIPKNPALSSTQLGLFSL